MWHILYPKAQRIVFDVQLSPEVRSPTKHLIFLSPDFYASKSLSLEYHHIALYIL